ncbi:unnamed protein product [Cyprideis torosa]|uniref:Uncharacterized protein n=1 Tax=Cyprideis torosa TaxID=163714 RepID=A0A7R8W273_9CRUS|nr:unnamed protein product [Cyprideis torosa]CAG0881681.1 unnamed protein product [Cyprideis torosa]
MIRRQARLRREFIYRKSIEERKKAVQDRRDKIKASLDNNAMIPTDLRRKALGLQKAGKWDDAGPEQAALLGSSTEASGGLGHEDDEYRWAGVSDPKIMITTSKDPSSRLKQFAKELKLLFPNSQRMNRGNYDMKQLISACRANEVTDFIIVHETRGNPDGLIVCHLPYGPTAFFTLCDVVMRHEVPNIGTMSEQYPHLIFHNFSGKLGERVRDVLKYLFPVPKPSSKRVLTFANHEDFIAFRHHTYKKGEGKEIELKEVGPRFQLRLYEIRLGTLDQGAGADVEWALRPYMNTSRKRLFLSNLPGWKEDTTTAT